MEGVVVVEADTQALKRAARTELVALLRARQATGEPVSAMVRQSAGVLGISERTVWRALRRSTEQPGRLELPEDWVERYLSWGGNVAAVWRELDGEGAAGCSLRAMQRRFAAGMTAAQRAVAKGGEDARRAHGLCLRFEAEHRNHIW